MAEFKYPKKDGWRHVWIFEHHSYHAAMVDDVRHMNVNSCTHSASMAKRLVLVSIVYHIYDCGPKFF